MSSNTLYVDLIFKTDHQVYAQVTRMLEDGRRCEAMCSDGTKRICVFPRSKKVRIGPGDIILVCVWDGSGDVIVKYTPAQSRQLKVYGELPENMNLDGEEEGDDNFEA